MFCPEDGVKCTTKNLDHDACYDCPECGTHWVYVFGCYTAVERENCEVCTALIEQL